MKILLSAILGALILVPAIAEERYRQGDQYELIPIPVEASNDGIVEVVEIFSYGCVHCYNFDPYVEVWKQEQKGAVKFERLPAVFTPEFAKAYYAAEILDVVDEVHTPIFNALHIERKDMRRREALAEVFKRYGGVPEDDFLSVYDSFAVQSRVQQAQARVAAYRVTGIPTMIVSGKYRIDGRMAGSNNDMLKVVDHLVGLELD
jgi:thiol:disulfide interchange protein DsbA